MITLSEVSIMALTKEGNAECEYCKQDIGFGGNPNTIYVCSKCGWSMGFD